MPSWLHVLRKGRWGEGGGRKDAGGAPTDSWVAEWHRALAWWHLLHSSYSGLKSGCQLPLEAGAVRGVLVKKQVLQT